MVAHLVRDEGVVGSNPAIPTNRQARDTNAIMKRMTLVRKRACGAVVA